MDSSEKLASEDLDPTFAAQVQRLHFITIYGRWLVIVLLWATVGVLSLWGLRSEIELLLEHFTWAALRYTVTVWYNPLPSIGLIFCISMTVSVLVWQSRNILFGMSPKERQRLEQQVIRIRHQGPTHPMWKLICRD